MMRESKLVLLLANLLVPAVRATYKIQDTFIGKSFFDNFDFFTGDDPTHGRVNYVSMDQAKSTNLSFGELAVSTSEQKKTREGRGKLTDGCEICSQREQVRDESGRLEHCTIERTRSE
jgi:hypothetical protein